MPSLTNPDLAPTTPAQRTWSTWHIAALWIGMAVCIPTYTLAAGMIGQGMSWWQATLTVFLGNLIVLVPMILNGHPGAKYGIPFPVLMRASFGTVGANIPALARAFVACGWFGIQTWIGGAAIYQVLGALGAFDPLLEPARVTFLGITLIQLACFFAFWMINLHFIWHGMDSIKWLESWSAPFLLAVGLALLGWAMWKVDSVAALFSQPSKFSTAGEFWKVFVPQLTAMVGFWATLSLNIPDFTRFARSQKSQFWGQALGLPPTMTLFAFIGIIVTQATVMIFGAAIWDPVELVSKLGSPAVVILALAALSVATLTTNIAANVVSPANDFANLWPSRISFRTGGIITAVVGVVMMPWYLYTHLAAYIFTWLIGYSALLGPIAGIMLCDYYVRRRTRLNATALYDPRGEYSYTGGINWRAVGALLLAVAPNVPGFINAATNTAGTDRAIFGPFWDSLYGYAWFIGLALGFIVYFVLMGGSAVRGNKRTA
ncbi:MAG TPA: NCS1 family nucleobase:cation symporter-1 [Phycisphaerales bacterium]|nr:NCS1 family nucleobase:cation symporter-1 [Phycisphaerales bacterium]